MATLLHCHLYRFNTPNPNIESSTLDILLLVLIWTSCLYINHHLIKHSFLVPMRAFHPYIQIDAAIVLQDEGNHLSSPVPCLIQCLIAPEVCPIYRVLNNKLAQYKCKGMQTGADYSTIASHPYLTAATNSPQHILNLISDSPTLTSIPSH